MEFFFSCSIPKFFTIQFKQQIGAITKRTVKKLAFTSRMLAQTVAAIGFAATRFSPAIIVKLVIIGFELNVSSASAV